MYWWIEAFVKILPAYLANTAPLTLLFIDRWGLLKPITKPLDGGRKLKDGTRLFGDGKTWLGFFGFPLYGVLVALLLQGISTHTWFSGLLLGFGAFFGDLAGSFIKRRKHMKRGSKAGLLDQVDFILGAVLFSLPVFVWALPELLLLFLVTPFVHRTTNFIGYKLKMKDVPW
ncbi:MAG: CDP-2,3-bis-(O-geranylgeranyl)-sn-glycerol synthase [Candidatus Altiarchaeota archaeon]|nr:CDP-2,3-bis-(O-geranylgeranyl)-sn-glycerol synthase [Candidatus Altiarchaeota archaeon]